MPHSECLRCQSVADVGPAACRRLAGRFGVALCVVADGESIPGSYWGEPEAGLIGRCVAVRLDTPVHSFLHELAHIACMTAERRNDLYRDAGGDDLEEAAVCFLQIVLADSLEGAASDRLMRDMDAWGYSFRLGSAAAWFRTDAADARRELRRHGVLGDDGRPTFRLRGE